MTSDSRETRRFWCECGKWVAVDRRTGNLWTHTVGNRKLCPQSGQKP